MKVQRLECKACHCILQENIHFIAGKRFYTNRLTINATVWKITNRHGRISKNVSLTPAGSAGCRHPSGHAS